MTKKRQLTDIEPEFKQSKEFETLTDFEKSKITDILETISDTTGNDEYRDYTKWDSDFIVVLILSLFEQLGNGTAQEAARATIIYDVLKAALHFLASKNKLKVPLNELDSILNAIDSEITLDSFHKIHEPNYQDPTLPEWRRYVADDISNYMDEWIDAYVESSDWAKRPKGVTEDFLSALMFSMTENAYNIYRKTPKTWTKTALNGVMENEFITNMDLQDEDFRLIVPAMSAFIDFVAENGWINEQKAANYKRYLAAGEEKMIEASHNDTKAGPAKLIYKEMEKQGINMENDEEVEKFIQDLNENGGIDSLLPNDEPNGTRNYTDGELATILTDKDALESFSQIVDPNFEVNFLGDHHLIELGNKKWSTRQAKTVHFQGIKDGIKMWLGRDRNKYELPAGIDVVSLVGTVAELEDTLYSQHLQTPKQWTPATWREFGQWARNNQSMGRNKEATKLFTSVIRIQADNKRISPQKANELLFAMRGENNNIISLDDTRRKK